MSNQKYQEPIQGFSKDFHRIPKVACLKGASLGCYLLGRNIKGSVALELFDWSRLPCSSCFKFGNPCAFI